METFYCRASVWASASGSGTKGRSGAHSAAVTAVKRRAAEPQTEAHVIQSVRDEREQNAAERPRPGRGRGRPVGAARNEASVGHGGATVPTTGGRRGSLPFLWRFFPILLRAFRRLQ